MNGVSEHSCRSRIFHKLTPLGPEVGLVLVPGASICYIISGYFLYGYQQNAPSGERAHFVSPKHFLAGSKRSLTFSSFVYTTGADVLSRIVVELHAEFENELYKSLHKVCLISSISFCC